MVKHMSFFPEDRWTKNEPMFDLIWILYLLWSSQTHVHTWKERFCWSVKNFN